MSATSIDLFSAAFILALLVLLVAAVSRGAPGEKVKPIDNGPTLHAPLASRHGFVRFRQPGGAPDVSVTYHLQRAAPDRAYLVSIHIFHRDLARSDQSAYANPISEPGIPLELPQTQEFVNLTTDAFGNADFTFNVTGLGPGEYDLAFDAQVQP